MYGKYLIVPFCRARFGISGEFDLAMVRILARFSRDQTKRTKKVRLGIKIIRVISKSNERAARARFEFTNMISDQNCTTPSSIATLLDQF